MPLVTTGIAAWAPGVSLEQGQVLRGPDGDLIRRTAAGGAAAGFWGSAEQVKYARIQRGSFTVNVKHHGAAGDGSTDDSAAFARAMGALLGTVNVSAFPTSGSQVSKFCLEIPPGEYLITQPGALLNAASGARFTGLAIRGAGQDVTRIRFAPTDPGPTGSAYLAVNNDKASILQIEGITFSCSVANASFMQSISNGISNYSFRDCRWEGSWRWGFRLTGTNTNSEFTWSKCMVSGSWTSFLSIPSEAEGGNDQFLNYDFFTCSVFLTAGDFVDLQMGGNVNIWGGSYTFGGDGSTVQRLLSLRGNVHGSGVCRALVAGARLEIKHALSQAVYSEWNGGSILFTSVDMAALAPYVPASTVTAEFRHSAGPGPNIAWQSCSLMGQHKYAVSNSGGAYPRVATYRNCDMYQHAHGADMIVYDEAGTITSRGAYPQITFDGCRTMQPNGNQYAVDCTLNWDAASNATSGRERILQLSDSYGPPTAGGSWTVQLPLGAVISKVVFDRPSSGGGYAGTSWSYVITDGASTSVATYSPGSPWNAGFHSEIAAWRKLDTSAKRTLTLTATGITANEPTANLARVLVYYIT
ncbi:glycosyl hydrolase family 28-related protein [Kineosporia sp. NBRC 101731]|uniref:glycosyl hydrolase family 28-related protein n=1 Tax=Kineosporia sp. NBRC 101731 TaxID=3032199 RepID=UPI00332D8BE4